jgi:hypothetical protein
MQQGRQRSSGKSCPAWWIVSCLVCKRASDTGTRDPARLPVVRWHLAPQTVGVREPPLPRGGGQGCTLRGGDPPSCPIRQLKLLAAEAKRDLLSDPLPGTSRRFHPVVNSPLPRTINHNQPKNSAVRCLFCLYICLSIGSDSCRSLTTDESLDGRLDVVHATPPPAFRSTTLSSRPMTPDCN